MDPYADQGAGLAIGTEEVYGQPARVMQAMGKEHVLSLATIKRHYDALGSYLHFPTMEQHEKGDNPSLAGLRDRCNALIEEISKVLASPIFNLRFKIPLTFECHRCGSPISKGMPLGASNVDVRCTQCNALYKLSHDVASKETKVTPVVKEVPCSDLECARKVELWDDEISVGTSWACPDCSRRNTFALFVTHREK
jgi:DNA-directed RNA polymerase subunit RPC12/RpoP